VSSSDNDPSVEDVGIKPRPCSSLQHTVAYLYGRHGQAYGLALNANRACLDVKIRAGHAKRKATLEPTHGDVGPHNTVAASGLSTIRETKVGADGHAMVERGFLQEKA
jgi:hypothetical protein